MFPTSVYENATLKVVYGNKGSYLEIEGWKLFANIIEMADSEPITLTANSYTIEYGEPIPTFAFTSKGGHLSGTPAITCEGSTLLNAGTYPIVIKQGSVENANVTYVNGTLTIEILMGDVNGDGFVTMDDVHYLSDYIKGKRSYILFKSAHLNGDEKLDAADIVLLVSKIKSAQ